MYNPLCSKNMGNYIRGEKKQEIKTKKLFGLGLMSSENEEKIDPRMKKR